LELFEPQVEDVGVHALADDAGDLDLFANEVERDWRVGIRAPYGYLHFGAGRTTNLSHQLVERFAPRGLPVDGDDAISRADAGPVGGRALDDGDDSDGLVAQIDLDADADELSLGVALKKAKILRRHVGRMGVELVDHPFDRPLDDALVVDRFDVLV